MILLCLIKLKLRFLVDINDIYTYILEQLHSASNEMSYI